MKAVFRRFIRFIPINLLLVAVGASAATTMATGKAMEPLVGMSYKLYAKQRETQSYKALNCITSVIFALRREGFVCPNMDFNQGFAFWWPRASKLRIDQTPVSSAGVLLLTRSHFLLLYADQNDNGQIDVEDLVIHANFKPVEITSIGDWMRASPEREIRYVPIDESFVCPTVIEAAKLRGPQIR